MRDSIGDRAIEINKRSHEAVHDDCARAERRSHDALSYAQALRIARNCAAVAHAAHGVCT